MTYKWKRRTNYEREKEMQRVKAELELGKNAREISKETGIPYSTCARYVQKITLNEKKKQEEIEGDTLENRAQIIRKKYIELADVCQEILSDPKKSSKDRLDAGKLLVACQNNLYNMNKQGIITGNNNIPIGNVPKFGEVSKLDTNIKTNTKTTKRKKRRDASI